MDQDSKKQEALKNFFKKLIKKPSKRYAQKEFYGYDENGNLVVTDADKNVVSTIELEYYRGYSKDEFDELEKERLDKIIELENKIDEQRVNLSKAENIDDEFNIHTEIANLEKQRAYTITPYRSIKRVKGLEVRDVQMEDQAEEKRKQKLVYQVVCRDYPLANLYGKYTHSKEVINAIEQKGIRLNSGEVFLTNGRVARFFNENEVNNEFLSIYLVREFVYNETKFSSPYQAFEVTRLMELGKEDLAKKVLNTRSIKTIRYYLREVLDVLPDTKDLWSEILSEYYKQHSDLIKKLIDTKEGILVFANANPYLGGIGLTSDDPKRLDTKNWKHNIVGEVLMSLRSEFLQGMKTEKQEKKFTQSTISEEEVEMKKKAAIISSIKKKKSVSFE
jgi:predicted NAD-dependent protein-ADP-ribosyltransferase YbiA (DUF1768 family)